MEKSSKKQFLLVAFGVCLYAILMNFGTVTAALGRIFNLIFPVILGFLLAFIFNVPMAGFEKLIGKVNQKAKRKLKDKHIMSISLLLTFVCVILIVALVCTMIIPEVVASVKSLYVLFLEKWPEWAKILQSYDIDVTWLVDFVESIDMQKVIQSVSNGANSIITSTFDIASSAVSGVTNVLIALIIAIYVLLSKKDLARQVKRLLDAHLKEKDVKYLCHVGSLVNGTYSKFLSGQCLEACILGGLIFIVFGIIGIPYASLIGVLTAVCAFVPYIGAFLSCAVGAFLVLLANPSQVILCVVVYFIVQFIENQFIYPQVVGTSVGLSPLWTLIAVFAGGQLMGLFGMIFFIPLTAVFVTLLREHTDALLAKKKSAKSENTAAHKGAKKEHTAK